MKRRASLKRLACAKKTIMAIDEVEETLRRLGLRNDAGSLASNTSCEGGAQNYVAAIRKAKEEAMKLRHEKEYRQFAAEEQKQEKEAMALCTNKEMALRDVIKQGLSLLEQETRSANEVFLKNAQKSTDQHIRANKLSKKKTLQDHLQQTVKLFSDSESFGDQQPVIGAVDDAEIQARKKRLKAQATREYCRIIAAGIAEVAMRVAEHTYTIGMNNDSPVMCLPQDISLSTWNAWVNELIFSKTVHKPLSDLLATNSLRECCNFSFKNNKIQKYDSVFSLKTASDIAPSDALETAVDAVSNDSQLGTSVSRAEDIVRRVIDMQQSYGTDLIFSGVTDAIWLVKTYERNKLCLQLDNIRRKNESESLEEVLPGWTHRLPPAGCFLYGDELSGLKAFTDMACGDVLPQTSGKRHHNQVFSPDTLKILESECCKWDVESYRVLTPQLLVRTPHSGCAGQGGGAASGGGYLTLSQRMFNKGSTMSQFNAMRGRECKQNEEIMESKQYIDALCDQLTKEIIAVYQHNLQLLLRSDSHPVEVKEASQVSLRTLFLVGFPETGIFWRTLYQRLQVAVEIIEQETNRALMAEETGEDPQPVYLPSNKARSGRKTGRTHADESPLRKKCKKPSLVTGSGKKGGKRCSLPLNEEETPPLGVRVYPPLCLCGIFFQYDLISRYRRMQEVGRNKDPFSTESIPHKTVAAEEGSESFSDWSLERLRQELLQQDKKMKNLWKVWSTTVSRAAVPSDFEGAAPPLQERQKKRSRVFVLRKMSEPTAGSTQSSTATVVSAFPKVFFFRRKEDISTSVKFADFLEFISTTLTAVLNPSVWSVTRNALLVPGQLPPPLKLSDYRFSPLVRLQLVELERRFQLRWNKAFKVRTNTLVQLSDVSLSQPRPFSLMPPLSVPQSLCCSYTIFLLRNEDKKLLLENIVWLEIEMHRVFRVFFLDLLNFMNESVFPPSLWSTSQQPDNHIDPNTSGGVEIFGRTLHFFSLDENYAASCESLALLFDNGMLKLTYISAMLLRCILDLAVTYIGEALARLCFWACDHFCAIPFVGNFTENNAALPSNTVDAHTTVVTASNSCTTAHMPKEEKPDEQEGVAMEGNSLSSKQVLISNNVMESFLATVPRLSFENLLEIVTQLDGRSESFKKFQQDLWSYASRVHHAMLDCLLKFIEDVSADVCVENTESFLAMAPNVSEVLVAYLFAFLPPEKMMNNSSNPNETANFNVVSEICSAVISVPIGRTVAAIRVLRRCCIVAGLCSARWIDSMYASALKISPQSLFPLACRPVDIVDIFWPPDVSKQEGGASPPSLALQLLSSKTSEFFFSIDEERNCWWETEMELFLQSFSIYQKPVIDKNEFLHCFLLAELSHLWKVLPVKAHIIAECLGVSFSFSPNSVKNEDQGKHTTWSVPYFGSKRCFGNDGVFLLTEEEALQLFWDAVQGQQKCLSKRVSFADACQSDFLTSSSVDVVVTGSFAKKPLLRLREFFLCVILQRIRVDKNAESAPLSDHVEAVYEPSTMELRSMVRSLPCAVRQQCSSGDLATTEAVSIDDWKCIKWWQFFDGPQYARLAAFIQRYMLRLLTVCFGFVNGELSSRPTPLLPDVLFMAATTEGCQATLERYFHAISALRSYLHEKRWSQSQSSSPLGSAETMHKETSSLISDGPLLVFDLALSVDEVLFFFQHTGETGLCRPCPRGRGYRSSSHMCEPRGLASVFVKEDGDDESVDLETNNDDDDTLPLATELTLLQDVENCSSITLTLLGASHWGRFIAPRLTALSL